MRRPDTWWQTVEPADADAQRQADGQTERHTPQRYSETKPEAEPEAEPKSHAGAGPELLSMTIAVPMTVIPRKRRGVELVLILFDFRSQDGIDPHGFRREQEEAHRREKN